MQKITIDDYLKGRDKQYPITDEMRANAIKVVEKHNQLIERFGQYRGVNSGYRPAELNAKTVGASKTSKHMQCLAVDIEDADKKLKEFCLKDNEKVLNDLDVWMEDPLKTNTWCHIQIIKFNSYAKGKTRIFKI